LKLLILATKSVQPAYSALGKSPTKEIYFSFGKMPQIFYQLLNTSPLT